MGRIWRIWARKRCSRWTTRSITSLKDDGAGENVPALCGGGTDEVEPCGNAGNAPSRNRVNARKPTWKIRITPFWERTTPIEKLYARRQWNRLVGHPSSPA